MFFLSNYLSAWTFGAAALHVLFSAHRPHYRNNKKEGELRSEEKPNGGPSANVEIAPNGVSQFGTACLLDRWAYGRDFSGAVREWTPIAFPSVMRSKRRTLLCWLQLSEAGASRRAGTRKLQESLPLRQHVLRMLLCPLHNCLEEIFFLFVFAAE